jgi:hypothetical protein
VRLVLGTTKLIDQEVLIKISLCLLSWYRVAKSRRQAVCAYYETN